MTITQPGQPPRTDAPGRDVPAAAPPGASSAADRTLPTASASAAPAPMRAGRRDAAIDTIRGICIIMMTFSHLAEGTVAEEVSHPAPWVDGASGFVLMSGLVLGLVQPGRIGRSGLLAAEVKLLRRAGLLYAAHVSTVLLAVLAGHFAPSVAWFPHTEDHGGTLGTIRDTLFLQINPQDIDILSLYVILLVFAMVATALLARGLSWLVGVGSVALYIVASGQPSAFTLPIGDGELSKFNWGAWQLLFLSALVVGWYWKRADLRSRLTSRRALLVAGAAWVLLTGTGVLFARMGLIPAVQPGLHDAFYNKSDQGLARFALSWAAFITLYGSLTWVLARISPRWLAPVETIGKRSLASFIVLTVITVLVPVAAGDTGEGVLSMGIAVLSLIVMYGYVLLRYGRPGRPASAPATSDTPATEDVAAG
ncbi:MAG: OpgC domain-containing protein [Nakamurella sp.]